MSDIENAIQSHWEYTDEQMANLGDNQIKYLKKVPEYLKYNLVATVVESENCGCKVGVGDRIVLNGGGVILPNQCTNQDKLCMFAVAPLLPFVYLFQDRIASDVDPNECVWKRVQCADTGVERCGWGQITMEVNAEKI